MIWIIPHGHAKPRAGINEDQESFLYKTASCSRPENPCASVLPAHFLMAAFCFFSQQLYVVALPRQIR
jgi:hypothetical protein